MPIAEKLAKEGKRVKSTQRMNRTISTVAVADGMVFVPDFSGTSTAHSATSQTSRELASKYPSHRRTEAYCHCARAR